MSAFGGMTVEVGYEIEAEPTEEHFRALRRAAEDLTNDRESIQISQRVKADRYVVLVTFSMRQMAQYKVVDDISHQFRMDFACYHPYLDMWIGFPRERARSPGRRRR